MTSSSLEKEAQRQAWARRESDHLREIRRMKSRPRTPLCGDQMASMYEVVKVLGKGSFGVVRLVREKVTEKYVPCEGFLPHYTCKMLMGSK